MKRTSAIRVLGRYLDNLCGPVPRVVVAADLKALKLASTRRIASVSGFMSDYEKWTAPAMRPEWRQWWTQGGKLVPLRGGSAEIEDGRFAANTVIWPGDSDEVQGDVHFEFITTNSDRRGQGLGAAVVKAIAAARPATVIYVSCDAATLARDLRTFGGLGYSPDHIEGFDLFPGTAHVETVVRLRRG